MSESLTSLLICLFKFFWLFVLTSYLKNILSIFVAMECPQQNEGLKAMDKENKQRRLESLYREELTRFKAARRHYRRLKRSKENCLLTAARQLTADATAGAADAADAADTAAGVAAGVATADDSIR